MRRLKPRGRTGGARFRTLSVLAVLCWSCPSALAQDEESAYALEHVYVVDVEHGKLLEDHTVILRGERIEALGPAAELVVPEGARRIDARGRYLLPGLFDAHVHFTSAPDSFGPMMVANGVLAARDVGGDTQQVLALKDQLRRGERLGPELTVTGAIIDGKPPVWPFSEPCSTPEEGRKAVHKLHDAGVDQIKVYSLLTPEVHAAILEEAKGLGLHVTGHSPGGMTVLEVMEAGQDCVEHLTGFEYLLADLAGVERDTGRARSFGFEHWAHFSRVDRGKLEEALAQLGESGMLVCPTLVVMVGISRAGEEDARLQYVPSYLRAFWGGGQYQAMAQYVKQTIPMMQEMVKGLYDAGVPLMVGTDLANPNVFAGFAVHEEMQMFAEAGIPAADVLRAATLVPATFCNVDDRLGTVAAGKAASVVLVRGNPLEDVRHAAEVEEVFLRGQRFDRAALDAMLEEVKATATGAPAASGEGEVAERPELPGELVARGTYELKFSQFDAGTESFEIRSDGEAFHLLLESRPQGGGQTPFDLVVRAGLDGAFQSAQYREHGGQNVEAEYVREGDRLRAEARQGDTSLGSEDLELPEGVVFGLPALSAEFLTVQELSLEPGESRETPVASFGVQTWKPTLDTVTITRLEDESLPGREGTAVPTRHLRYEQKTEIGDFVTDLWADPAGVILKTELSMPFGELTATLRKE